VLLASDSGAPGASYTLDVTVAPDPLDCADACEPNGTLLAPCVLSPYWDPLGAGVVGASCTHNLDCMPEYGVATPVCCCGGTGACLLGAGVEFHGHGVEVRGRDGLVLEVSRGVLAPHQGCNVAFRQRLAGIRRYVADGHADTPVVAGVGRRGVGDAEGDGRVAVVGDRHGLHAQKVRAARAVEGALGARGQGGLRGRRVNLPGLTWADIHVQTRRFQVGRLVCCRRPEVQ